METNYYPCEDNQMKPAYVIPRQQHQNNVIF